MGDVRVKWTARIGCCVAGSCCSVGGTVKAHDTLGCILTRRCTVLQGPARVCSLLFVMHDTRMRWNGSTKR